MKKLGIVVLGLCLAIGVLGYLWLTIWSRSYATAYASGFSEAKFAQVRRGMSKADVRRILGQPLAHLEALPQDDRKWFYAFLDCNKIPTDDRVTNTWFNVREVDFDAHGRVKMTLKSTEQFE